MCCPFLPLFLPHCGDSPTLHTFMVVSALMGRHMVSFATVMKPMAICMQQQGGKGPTRLCQGLYYWRGPGTNRRGDQHKLNPMGRVKGCAIGEDLATVTVGISTS